MKLTHRNARRLIAPIVAVAVAGTMAAFGGSSKNTSGSGSSGGEYIFGAALPLTGPTTIYGANLTGGLQAYINYVNDNGGVNGKKIKLVQADAGFDTATTVQSLKTLAGSKPIAIGGLLVGSATEGAMPTIGSLKVTALISSPVSTFNRPPANAYSYGAGGPVIEDEAVMMTDFMKAKLVKAGQTPKIVTINYNSNGSALALKNFISAAKANNWNIVDQENYTTGTTNFDAQAAKIAAAKPDYILYSADAANQAFIQALKNAGVTATIITDQGGPHADQLAQLDYPSIYVLREIVYPTGTSQAVTDYLSRVKAVGGKADPNSHVTQYGYLQAEVFVKVLQKCGADCNASSFLDTIKNIGTIDTDGFTFGPLKYTAGSTAGLDTASFYTWDSAKKEPTLLDGTYTYPN